MKDVRTYLQAIWGGALLLMGVAVIFRIPSIMVKMSDIKQDTSGQLFLKFCLYLMAILLIGGGVKKLHAFMKRPPKNI